MAIPSIRDLKFFLDRGLGAYAVPRALRAASWYLTTMDERYGKEKSQRVSDQKWIADASDRDEVLLCKDTAIASNPAEARAVYMQAARVFALPDAALSGEAMAKRYLDKQDAIVRMAVSAEGPYVVAVGQDRLRRRRLAYA